MASLQGPGDQRHDLIGEVLKIGRDPTNDIVITDDPRVSRTQAEVRFQNGQWFLVDLDSRNGTMVNHRRTSVHPLRDRDQIGFGTTTLIFIGGFDENATEIGSTSDADSGPDLSGRERQILQLLALGSTDKEIGDQLHISVSTVRSHLDRIRDKTGLRRRSELTRLAIELRIAD